ncbi:phospholipase-like protein [Tanacetum coccineum]
MILCYVPLNQKIGSSTLGGTTKTEFFYLIFDNLFDEADVDSYDDDYMSVFNDEVQPAKSSLNDLELQQEPDIVDVKDGILEQQANADKGKTIVIQETVGVKVEEQPSLGRGWLTDQHLDVWIDLMWSLRPPEADWAIVSPHFSTCILNGMMQDYFSNGHMYPLPWIAVEKVYFPVNEPKQHWCLAQLEIRTGVVTFYDSLGWAGGSRRRWWRRMKKVLPEKLTLYLLMHGIFDSKGISADHYKITYNYASVPFQASLYGDCGIWVCIFIYRLCRNLPVAVDNDPLETALAYRERMLEFFWNHKILVEKTSSFV